MEQWRARSRHFAALARGTGNLRARISAGADQPLRRQHLAHGHLHWHGAFGAAPEAEIAGRRPEQWQRAAIQRMTSAHHGWPEGTPIGRIAYVNGRYLPHARAAVHIEDRGLQFADAIYEVVGVFDGAFLDEEEHFERLERSVGEIGMPPAMGRAS